MESSASISLNTSVVVRSDFVQLSFDLIAHLERVDKLRDALLCDGSIRARKRLECFIRMRIGFATKDRLDRFCTNCPVMLEVSSQSFLT